MMRYGSVCSGIESATVAWHPLGWKPQFFAEVDKFPSAVLAHHYPDVPNLGDFTTIGEGDAGPIDLLVGGTPCQSFSVAGKRLGLDDPRGNLALEYLALAGRLRPAWLVFENVPGLLSSDEGRDFGAFLGALVECGYGWAYRVIDAQYVRVDGYPRAVPQRRRRVLLVGYLGDWRPAAAVLLEPEGLRGDSPPRREAGKGIAPTIASRPSGGGGLGTYFDCDGGLVANAVTCDQRHAYPEQNRGTVVAHSLNAKGGSGRVDGESETFVAHTLSAEGFDASEDGTGRGTPIIPILEAGARTGKSTDDPRAGAGIGEPGDPMFSLQSGKQHAVAFTCSANSGGFAWERDVSPTLDTFRPTELNNIQKGVRIGRSVRRLTPRECERLQGFPDDYTLIPYRGKQAADGPRYKALGNAMAIPMMRWIGARIALFQNLTAGKEAA